MILEAAAGVVGLALGYAFIRGATAKPSPRRAVSNQQPNALRIPARGGLNRYLNDETSTEISGGGDVEVWDGADPTGPAPSP